VRDKGGGFAIRLNGLPAPATKGHDADAKTAADLGWLKPFLASSSALPSMARISSVLCFLMVIARQVRPGHDVINKCIEWSIPQLSC
jgi:hypothetical protein